MLAQSPEPHDQKSGSPLLRSKSFNKPASPRRTPTRAATSTRLRSLAAVGVDDDFGRDDEAHSDYGHDAVDFDTVASLAERYAELESENFTLMTELGKLRKARNWASLLADQERELERVKLEADQSELEKNDIRETVKILERQIVQIKREHENDLQDIERERAEFYKERKEWDIKAARNSKIIKDLTEDNYRLQDAASEDQGNGQSTETLEEQKNALRKQISEARSNQMAALAEAEMERERAMLLVDQLLTKDAEIKRLRGDIDDISAEFRNLQERCEKLQNALDVQSLEDSAVPMTFDRDAQGSAGRLSRDRKTIKVPMFPKREALPPASTLAGGLLPAEDTLAFELADTDDNAKLASELQRLQREYGALARTLVSILQQPSTIV
eukprot:jgi/Hompol1/2054/HPOL_005069-RA